MSCAASNPRFRFSDSHYASVLRVAWTDDTGAWGVQGALLDEWTESPRRTTSIGDIAVVIRWNADKIAFLVSVRNRTAVRLEKETKTRWTSRDTMRVLPPRWIISTDTLRRLTVAIARVIEGEAIILPDGV
jgi:hypothetical protein